MRFRAGKTWKQHNCQRAKKPVKTAGKTGQCCTVHVTKNTTHTTLYSAGELDMLQIPFFPKLAIYSPIITGIAFILFSFSKKQYSAMVKNLGESTAKKAHLLFRYGGAIMFLSGVIQYLLKDY